MGNINSRRKAEKKQSNNVNIHPRETEVEVESVNDVRDEVFKTISCSSKEYQITKTKYRDTELEAKSISDLPNEVIQKNIMMYLSNDDVRSFGRTGSKRFKVIADDELEKRRK